MSEGGFILLEGIDRETVPQFETITVYRMRGASLSWRFRLSWALARLAFWLWTASDAEGEENDA